jgi:hypothetical protein
MNTRIKLYNNTALANNSDGYRVGQNNRVSKLYYETKNPSFIENLDMSKQIYSLNY